MLITKVNKLLIMLIRRLTIHGFTIAIHDDSQKDKIHYLKFLKNEPLIDHIYQLNEQVHPLDPMGLSELHLHYKKDQPTHLEGDFYELQPHSCIRQTIYQT